MLQNVTKLYSKAKPWEVFTNTFLPNFIWKIEKVNLHFFMKLNIKVRYTKEIFLQLDNFLRLRLSNSVESKIYKIFYCWYQWHRKMGKTLNKCMTEFDYAGKTCFVRREQWCFFLLIYDWHWYTIKNASISLVFFVSNEIAKMFLKS